jgi:hypothetical protein
MAPAQTTTAAPVVPTTTAVPLSPTTPPPATVGAAPVVTFIVGGTTFTSPAFRTALAQKLGVPTSNVDVVSVTTNTAGEREVKVRFSSTAEANSALAMGPAAQSELGITRMYAPANQAVSTPQPAHNPPETNGDTLIIVIACAIVGVAVVGVVIFVVARTRGKAARSVHFNDFMGEMKEAEGRAASPMSAGTVGSPGSPQSAFSSRAHSEGVDQGIPAVPQQEVSASERMDML